MPVHRLVSHPARALGLTVALLATSCADGEPGEEEAVAESTAALAGPVGVCALVPVPLPRVGATASSVEAPNLAPGFAIDGDPGTRWSSAFHDPEWLQLDLGAVRYIDTVTLSWETASSQRYELAVSDDGAHWKVVKVVPYNGAGAAQVSYPGLNARGRYLRVESSARNTAWGISLFEVSVAGDPNGACTQPGAVRIDAVHSGKALDVRDASDADGAAVQQWGYGGGRNQKWTVSHVGYGQELEKLYEIRSVRSGKCLDVADGSTADRAPLQQWTCNGNLQQRFSLRAAGAGYYQLVAAHSGKCLDVEGGSTADGARVIQWPCHDGDNQKWAILDPRDLDTDGENCGRAGHSCFGGACVSGVCQAALVSTAFQCATSMTASDEHVYVADVGQIQRFDASGYNRTTLVPSAAQDFVSDLVRRGNQLFYRTSTALHRLTLGESPPVTLFEGEVYQLSVNQTSVLGYQGTAQRFVAVDRQAGGPGPARVVADLQGVYPMLSAATDTHLYYVTGTPEGTSVVQVDLQSGDRRVLDDPSESIFGLTAYGDRAYWSYRTAGGQSGIRRIGSAPGASVEEAVLPVQAPAGLGNPLVDASGIYYSSYSGQSGAMPEYVRTPLDVPGQRQLVSTGASPYSSTNAAMTSDSIFWMSTCHRYGGGWLYRLAKP